MQAAAQRPQLVPGAMVLLEVRSPQPHTLLAREYLQGVGVDGSCALQGVVGHTLEQRDRCETAPASIVTAPAQTAHQVTEGCA